MKQEMLNSVLCGQSIVRNSDEEMEIWGKRRVSGCALRGGSLTRARAAGGRSTENLGPATQQGQPAGS